SFIKSRLIIAKNILREDGIIFVSIDDKELPNIRKILDETFGEDNRLGTIVWKNATDNNPSKIAVEHEYIIVYSKQKASCSPVWRTPISDIKEKIIAIGDQCI